MQRYPIPKLATPLLPELKTQIGLEWPEAQVYKFSPFIAGQIEQESNWKSRAELKTSREYGFGLVQTTIAYDKNGKERFNNFKNFKRLDPDLANWMWEDRFNTKYQLKTVVVVDRYNFNMVKGAADVHNQFYMALNAYNGGPGGLLQDRRLCKATAGCDPSKWFNNVERTSYKSKVAVHGYSKSFFQISREYVYNIIVIRSPKYAKTLIDEVWS